MKMKSIGRKVCAYFSSLVVCFMLLFGGLCTKVVSVGSVTQVTESPAAGAVEQKEIDKQESNDVEKVNQYNQDYSESEYLESEEESRAVQEAVSVTQTSLSFWGDDYQFFLMVTDQALQALDIAETALNEIIKICEDPSIETEQALNVATSAKFAEKELQRIRRDKPINSISRVLSLAIQIVQNAAYAVEDVVDGEYVEAKMHTYFVVREVKDGLKKIEDIDEPYYKIREFEDFLTKISKKFREVQPVADEAMEAVIEKISSLNVSDEPYIPPVLVGLAQDIEGINKTARDDNSVLTDIDDKSQQQIERSDIGTSDEVSISAKTADSVDFYMLWMMALILMSGLMLLLRKKFYEVTNGS